MIYFTPDGLGWILVLDKYKHGCYENPCTSPSAHMGTDFLGYNLRVGLLSHTVGVFAALLDDAEQFSKVVVAIYPPTISVWEFHLRHTMPYGVIVRISHSDTCVVITRCGFNVHFPAY